MARVDRRRALIGGSAGAFAALLGRAALAQGTVRVTFVLTNDIYKISEEKGRGGLARLAAVVKAERAKGGHVVFSHAGDTLSPSLMSGFDKGQHMFALFNAMSLDVFAPGNHEFDFGRDEYLKRAGEAKFPILAANLRAADGSVLPGHRDTLVRDYGGVKIGFIGLALAETPMISSSEDLKFGPLVDIARSGAQALKSNGVDLVVVVAHADKATRLRLAETRGVDLVLNGHNHDLHIAYDGKSVAAESGEDAQYVVIVDVDVAATGEGDKRVVRWSPAFRIVDSKDVTPDPDILAMVKGYEDMLSRELDVEIATLAAPLDSRSATVRGGEAAIGNLIADSIRASTGADAAIVNGGGIRANRQYPVGHKLTRRDVLAELPFGNRTATTKITGKALRAALENGLSQVEQRGGRFPQVSGLKVIASLAAPAGQRVQSVEVNGQPLDEGRLYLVATNDFMLRGGDGYAALAGQIAATVDSGGALLANDVMVHARRLGVIDAKVEGRVVVR
ncbi:MAG: bifunctional metallophosphatase/5'-nucleotidase [Methylobacteriaceae bacterium]|nr:bifunctional metallophosphatase/5'-nucleotidase [Methylobacteriaceae bacterium]